MILLKVMVVCMYEWELLEGFIWDYNFFFFVIFMEYLIYEFGLWLVVFKEVGIIYEFLFID